MASSQIVNDVALIIQKVMVLKMNVFIWYIFNQTSLSSTGFALPVCCHVQKDERVSQLDKFCSNRPC